MIPRRTGRPKGPNTRTLFWGETGPKLSGSTDAAVTLQVSTAGFRWVCACASVGAGRKRPWVDQVGLRHRRSEERGWVRRDDHCPGLGQFSRSRDSLTFWFTVPPVK
jgi:hypothetical protein